MAEGKTIHFLWNCAKELSGDTHTHRLLKSYYINTCRKLAKHNVQLPEDCVGPARMCARCGNQWTDGNYQLHLKPQRLRNNAKRRRQIARLEATIKAKQKGPQQEQQGTSASALSTGARKRAKWLKKRMASNIAVECELCSHKTMLPLEKPKKRFKTPNTETMAAATTTTATTTTETATTATPATTTTEKATTTTPAAMDKRKKKNKNKNKNKDVNAGLKLPMEQQQEEKSPTVQKAAPTKAKTQTATKSAQSNKQKKKTKAAQSQQPKSTSTSAPKIQSKTQKQNALLQLAAQLKTHASKTASKTQQNRLQAFLK